MIHTHLADMTHIQLRQSAADVVEKRITASYDTKFRRFEAIGIIIKNIGNTMEGNGCFPLPATPWTIIFLNGLSRMMEILFFLNGGNNLAQDGVFMLR